MTSGEGRLFQLLPAAEVLAAAAIRLFRPLHSFSGRNGGPAKASTKKRDNGLRA
jgi:hypothetical protein